MNENYAQSSLGQRALEELKKRPFRIVAVDRTGLARKVLKAAHMWAAAVTLAEELRKNPNHRIGVVLPPGAGSWVADLAITIAGKSCVNLNFTAARDTATRAIKMAGIDTIISAPALREKFKDFPWEAVKFFDLPEFLGRKGLKGKLLCHLLEAICLPACVLTKIWKLGTPSPQSEATLLFSSGSTGTPKGIALTHENILTNVYQIRDIDLLPPHIRLMAVLPIFHSFGLTVQLWYSITHPIHVVTYPSPLDPAALAQIVREEKPNIMVGTASFFKLYMKSVDPKDFASFETVVAGAEKTPKGLHEAWQAKFGSTYWEGYGLTETSPVISVCVKKANRVGTVGRPVVGVDCRIVHPETREIITTPNTRGVLEVRGKNVFSGYLNDPAANTEVIHDGWFYTGDLASIAEDGYLSIEGRLRRFSKIAGEMIPHGGVEEAIQKALGRTQDNSAALVVTGVTDPQKGEALVILSEEPIAMDTLRSQLQNQGVPNLWIPKKMIKVEKIPLLPSGKLDLCAIDKLARGV